MILIGDVREKLIELPDKSVHCCVTSPPYFGLRDYGEDGQIGLEDTPEQFIANMVKVFREVWRVLRDDGTLWLNLGDSYNGSGGNHQPHHKNDTGFQGKIGAEKHQGQGRNISNLKPKDLIGIPWRVAFALQADGWYLRQDIIWHKPNPMPESVTDRCTKAHEYIFLLTKSRQYFFDHEAIAEPAANPNSGKSWETRKASGEPMRHGLTGAASHGVGGFQTKATRNRRSVWTVATKPFKGAHFATFPPQLIEPCILAGCPPDGTVLDPFFGAGTTGLVAQQHGRNWIGCELNPVYAEMAAKRIKDAEPQPKLFT